MSYKLANSLGVINIDNDVIARIAGLAALDCVGIVGMASKNVKDNIVQLLKKESLTKGIVIRFNKNDSENEQKLDIDFHIIVEYGTNISAIADNIISTVKYKVKEYIGIPVNDINIFVEGVRVDG